MHLDNLLHNCWCRRTLRISFDLSNIWWIKSANPQAYHNFSARSLWFYFSLSAWSGAKCQHSPWGIRWSFRGRTHNFGVGGNLATNNQNDRNTCRHWNKMEHMSSFMYLSKTGVVVYPYRPPLRQLRSPRRRRSLQNAQMNLQPWWY